MNYKGTEISEIPNVIRDFVGGLNASLDAYQKLPGLVSSLDLLGQGPLLELMGSRSGPMTLDPTQTQVLIVL